MKKLCHKRVCRKLGSSVTRPSEAVRGIYGHYGGPYSLFSTANLKIPVGVQQGRVRGCPTMLTRNEAGIAGELRASIPHNIAIISSKQLVLCGALAWDVHMSYSLNS